jgi:hypothetical protein
VGLRLALRKAQAEAGDIVLLFADESEAMTHPYLARAWAKCGADLRVQAPGQAKKVAMIGALDHTARKLIVHTSRTIFSVSGILGRSSRTLLAIKTILTIQWDGAWMVYGCYTVASRGWPEKTERRQSPSSARDTSLGIRLNFWFGVARRIEVAIPCRGGAASGGGIEPRA